ncbi:FG-GAP repeat protein [Neorhodopirellula pilleata]|uniref:FG-GAP repeat protein n=1 Tax=Neorhodopirellula pilleata TaxID=2714738 RepID=A0A5C5ZGQ7_9BACT|nr:FG-GAP repeat protein [Neorhodopirellula pilleata]
MDEAKNPMHVRNSLDAVAVILCILTASTQLEAGEPPVAWTKHVVTQGHHCNTAVYLDINRDRRMDVIASFDGKVSLFVAPEFEHEIVLHHFENRRGACIHSAVLDVDDDGDMDWAGAIANEHPFWLENPGNETSGPWRARPIDHEVTGIHCLLATDIDNDGKDDLIINNFEPEQGIGDSIAWLSVPEGVKSGEPWTRHVFADRDARGGSHYMGAADTNGDGWKEIAVGAKGAPFADGNWFAFWTHPGSNSMTGPWKKTTIAVEQPGATNMTAADINGDRKMDWVATRGHGVGVIWFENPDWSMHRIDDEIREPHSLAVADFDADGNVDVATCGYGSERVMVYLNDGRGNFETQTIDTNQQSYDLRAVDMDGDGDMDLLNAGRATRNVVWYENPSSSVGR